MKKLVILIGLLSFTFSQEITFDEAKYLYNDNAFDEAYEMIQTLIESNAENSEMLEMAAQIAFKLDDLKQASVFLNRAIKIDDKNKEYREFSKRMSEMYSKLSEAQKTFESGFPDEAIELYGKAIEMYPNFALLQYNLGMIYLRQKDDYQAVEHFRIAGELNVSVEKYKKAVRVIAQKTVQLGIEHSRRKDYDLAIESFLLALSYDSNYSDAMYRLGVTYYRVSEYNNARDILINNIELSPSNYQSYKLLGDTYNKLNELENAISNYKESIKFNPNYAKGYFALGRALNKNGDTMDAIEALNNAISIDPSNAKVFEQLGAIYQSLGKLDDAISNYNLSIANNPKSYMVYYRLASVYNEKEDYQSAQENSKKSLDIKRNFAGSFFELGVAEMFLCNKVASQNAFKKAKKDRQFKNSANDYIKNLSYYTKDCK